ncbi:MAG: formylglycine-generating enzyme family protein [Verrucomicrobiota bacterium]
MENTETSHVALPAPFPPKWAEGWGEDDFGTFAELRIGSATMEMRWIPPGRFEMGEKGGVRDVSLTQGFWLSATQCTQTQWRELVPENPNPSLFRSDDEEERKRDFDRRPVDQVSWDDCVAACDALNQKRDFDGLLARLPTEAEWEYACRAGTDTDFNDGSGLNDEKTLDELGWYDRNSGHRTHPVMEKRPNGWGLSDMHGNIWEWCSDWYGPLNTDTVEDPSGPESGGNRVLRGGGFWYFALGCRSASRNGDEPDFRDGSIGFRLALGQSLVNSSSKGGARRA